MPVDIVLHSVTSFRLPTGFGLRVGHDLIAAINDVDFLNAELVDLSHRILRIATSSVERHPTKGIGTHNTWEIAEDMLRFGNNAANDRYTLRCKEVGIKIHPARFPAALPDFFIRLLTDRDDIVLDPFAGSNTLGMVAEKLGRRWIAIEMEEEYLRASRFRFEDFD